MRSVRLAGLTDWLVHQVCFAIPVRLDTHSLALEGFLAWLITICIVS